MFKHAVAWMGWRNMALGFDTFYSKTASHCPSGYRGPHIEVIMDLGPVIVFIFYVRA